MNGFLKVAMAAALVSFANQAAAIDVNTSFTPTLLQPTQVSTLRIEFLNNVESPATDVALTNVLPDGVFISSPANLVTNCSGPVQASNGATGGSVSISGGLVPPQVGEASGTCFVEVAVEAAFRGVFPNTIPAGALTGRQSGLDVSNPQDASATLVSVLNNLTGTLSLGLGGNTLQGSETTTRTLTLTNPNDVALTGVELVHNLADDNGFNLRASGPVGGTCGGVTTISDAPSGGPDFGPTSAISVTDAMIPANSSCTITWNVTPARDATLPRNDTTLSHTIGAGSISTDQGATNEAAISQPVRTFTGVEVQKTFNGSANATINSNTATGANLSIEIDNANAAAISGLALADLLPDGLIATNIVRNTCGGTATVGAGDQVDLSAANLGAVPLLAGLQQRTCVIDARVEPAVLENRTYENTIPAGTLGAGGFQYEGTTATLSVVDTISPVNPLVVQKRFLRTAMNAGESQTMRFDITNTFDENIRNIDLRDDLIANVQSTPASPSDLRIGAQGVTRTTCNGSIQAIPNTTEIVISDVSLAAGQSCLVELDIQLASDTVPRRRFTNVIPQEQVTFDLVDEPGRQILNPVRSNTVQIFPAIYLRNFYSPATVVPGGISRYELRFIRGTSEGATTRNIAFVEKLPANHFIAPSPNIFNACGGTASAPAGGQQITLSGGSLDAPVGNARSVTCSVFVDVVAPDTEGSQVNNIPPGSATATDGGQPDGFNQLTTFDGSNARLTRELTDITVSKEFLPITIEAGQPSRVRITLDNTAGGALDLTGVTLTDNFAGTNLEVADAVDPTFTDQNGVPFANGCRGGSFAFVRGQGGSITLSNGQMDAGATCLMEFNATSVVGGNVPNRIQPGDVRTDQGATNPAPIVATLGVERRLNVSKGFGPEVVEPGQPANLTVSIINGTDTDFSGTTTGPSLIDRLPDGLSVVSGTAATTCAGGSASINSAGGVQELILVGGSFPANSVCTVTAQVLAGADGSFVNTISTGALSTNEGATNSQVATATLRSVQPPSIQKQFAPASIEAGTSTRLVFTLTNPNSAALLPTGLTGASFSDPLTNMVIASPPRVGGSCGDAQITGAAGDSTVAFTGASIPAAGSCTIAIDVTSSVVGTHPNTATGVTTDQTLTPGAPSNTVSLEVTPTALPTITKSFTESAVLPGTGTEMVITLTNPNATPVALGEPAFTDRFPDTPGVMSISDRSAAFTNCRGATLQQLVRDTNGGPPTVIRLTGGEIPANSSCVVRVSVEMDTIGVYENVTSGLETELGTSDPATATIEVLNQLPITSAVEADRLVRTSDNDFFVDSILGSGDTFGNNPATVGPGAAGNVDLEIVSISDGLTVDPDTGVIVVAGNTPPGTYTVTYEICQTGVPTNCAPQRTETVIISDAEIVATTDFSAAAPLAVSQADFRNEVGNVLGSSDTLDGVQATVAPGTGGNVDLTIDSITGPGGGPSTALSVNTNTGLITVNGGTPEGAYTITYTICEDDNFDNCATATETVEVSVTDIAAASEAPRTLVGSDAPQSAGNILGAGDTLDGVAATVGPASEGTVDLAIDGVTLDGGPAGGFVAVDPDTGEIVLTAGAPDGTYVISYTICEEANRSNCASATETITVGSPLVVAAPEANRPVNGSDGPVSAGSVFGAGDTIGGVPANAANTSVARVPGPNSDPELSLNIATGEITVAAGTPAGTYTIAYEICQQGNSDNCATAIETVVVTDQPITAVPEATRPIAQADAPVSAGSVLGAGDQINGAPATPGFGGNVQLTLVAADGPLSLNPNTGEITVAANTAPGTYEVTYQICDPANLDNCATATESVEVSISNILAQAEAPRPVTGADAEVSAGTVLGAGDTLNDTPVTVGPGGTVVLTVVDGPNTDDALSLDPGTGAITVAAGTPAGTYTIAYQICEAGNANNCATAIETVVVTDLEIVAAAEADRSVSQADAAFSAGSVLGAGDQIDGTQATSGFGGTVVLSEVSSDDALSLNTDTGDIVVAPGTLAGTYQITYQICDPGNLDNCATATETVVVEVNEILAAAEGDRAVTGSDDPIAAGSVLGAGDTLAGAPATLGTNGTVVLSVVDGSNTDDVLSLDPDTGILTVAAGTPAGTYTLEYQICEAADLDNCATAIETVVVSDTPIAAASEPVRTIAAADTDRTAGSALGVGDLLDGATAVVGQGGNVTISRVSGDAALDLDPATGLITVAGGTPAGTYTITYEICEIGNADNCATATETVEVVTTTIQAVAEAVRVVGGADNDQTAGTVLDPANDLLDGVAAVPGAGGSVVLSVVDGPNTAPALSLDPETGEITVAGGTPAGTYTIEYQICEATRLDNCATAIETVEVTDSSILAASEPDRVLTGSDDVLDAGNVLDPANDLLVGAPAQPGAGGTVVLTVVDGPFTSPALTLDPETGALTAAAGTPAGTYTLEYQICEVGNSDNCATAVETVVIADTVIVATTEADRAVVGSDLEQSAGNVLDSAGDQLAGAPAVPGAGGNVVLTAVAGPNASPELSLDPETGEITVAAGVPAGTYTLEYQICEVGNSDNCATAIETVVVADTVITASAEPARNVTGADAPVAAGNVLDGTNDLLGGAPAVPGAGGNVLLSTVPGPDTAPELSLDPETGEITVAAGTPAGTYTIAYEICEAANSDNCATAIETVVVTDTVITAGAEPERALFVSDLDQPAGNVLDQTNDLLGDAPAVPGAGGTVVLTPVPGPNTAPELTLDPETGEITVAAGTPPGTYTLAYQICEVANSDNCATAIETVVLTLTPIEATGQTFPAIDAAVGGTTTSVLEDDLLGGVPPVPGAGGTVVLSVVTPAGVDGITLDPETGLITVDPGTPGGAYDITYQICEVTNPDNCATATETVVVVAIEAVAEIFPAIETNGGTTTSMLASDTVGGAAATVDNVILTVLSQDEGVTLDVTTGLITLAPDLPAGPYVVEYQICNVDFPTACDTAFEIVTQAALPSVEATKTAQIIDNGDGIDGVGDTVAYTITVENTGNVPLIDVVVDDVLSDVQGTPRALDALPAYVSSDLGSGEGALALSETATYEASVVLTVDMVAAGGLSNSVTASGTPVLGLGQPGGDDPVSDLSDDGIDSDGNSTDDPTITLVSAAPQATGIRLAKTTPLANVLRGSAVPYTITVENDNPVPVGPVSVVDLLPSGFFFVEGSATVDGAPVTPNVSGRQVTFDDVTIPPLGSVTVTLSARVTTGVGSGTHDNLANVLNDGGQPLAPQARATVTIAPEPVFDCGEVIGTVFDDLNKDGYQNQGEPGLPGVRLAGVDGVLITTDQFGRYSFPCAMLPAAGIGTNFILKLDTRTLPSGYRVTTENPRVVRLTRGKITELNFGASIAQVVRIDLNSRAFVNTDGSERLLPSLRDGINNLLGSIVSDPSHIRLSYHLADDGSDERIARRRLNEVERVIRREWRGIGRYKLTIEKMYQRDQ